MKYVYKLTKDDDIDEIDIYRFLEMAMGEESVWAFDELNMDEFIDYELLDIKKNKRGEFVIYDSDTRDLKFMKISIDLVVLEECDMVHSKKIVEF